MDSQLLTIAPFLFIAIVMFVEYRNPLWRQFVQSGNQIPDKTEGATSDEMVFFWRGGETYPKSQDSDYWNAMKLKATSEGLLVERPFFLFGRRSAFFHWSALTPGKTFYTWLTRRRAIHISGTVLRFSITERFFKKHVQSCIESAK